MATNCKPLLALGSGIAVLVLALSASAADYRAVVVALSTIFHGDAQNQALIANLNALDAQPFGTLATGEQSKLARNSVEIAGNAERLGWPKVHIYWPDGKGPYPVVVYYHGGDTRIVDRGDAANSPRTIARSANAIVVAVSYASARNAAVTTSDEDAFSVYQWAQTHAGALGGDPTHIVVMGESGDGLLAAAVAIHAGGPLQRAPVYEELLYRDQNLPFARPRPASAPAGRI